MMTNLKRLSLHLLLLVNVTVCDAVETLVIEVDQQEEKIELHGVSANRLQFLMQKYKFNNA
jgi:hypothetical protein